MIKLSGKSRRVLRAIYRGLGVTAVSLVFQACYGPMPPYYAEYGMPPDPPYTSEEIAVRGYVKSKKTNERISGINIYIKGITYYNNTTNEDGRFYFYLPKQDEYTIVFTDIDGDEHGRFKQLTQKFTRIELENPNPLIIELEEVDEE